MNEIWHTEDVRYLYEGEYQWMKAHLLISKTFAFELTVRKRSETWLLNEWVGEMNQEPSEYEFQIMGYSSDRPLSKGEWLAFIKNEGDDLVVANTDDSFGWEKYHNHEYFSGNREFPPYIVIQFKERNEATVFLDKCKKLVTEDFSELLETEKELPHAKGTQEVLAEVVREFVSLDADELLRTRNEWYKSGGRYPNKATWRYFENSGSPLTFYASQKFLMGNMAAETHIGRNTKKNPVCEIFGDEVKEAPDHELIILLRHSVGMVTESEWEKRMFGFWESGVKLKDEKMINEDLKKISGFIEVREMKEESGSCLRFGFETLKDARNFASDFQWAVKSICEGLVPVVNDVLLTSQLLTDIEKYDMHQRQTVDGKEEEFEVLEIPSRNEWVIEKGQGRRGGGFEWYVTHSLKGGMFAFEVLVGEWTNGKMIEELLGGEEEAPKYKVVLRGFLAQFLYTSIRWSVVFDRPENSKKHFIEDFDYGRKKYLYHPLVVAEKRAGKRPKPIFSFKTKEEAEDFAEQMKRIISDDHHQFFEKEWELFGGKAALIPFG